MHILARLESLEIWRKHMDAQVTALVNEVTELKADVVAVEAAFKTALANLNKAVDAEDEAAIAQAVTDLGAVHTGLQSAIAPAAAAAPAAAQPVAAKAS